MAVRARGTPAGTYSPTVVTSVSLVVAAGALLGALLEADRVLPGASRAGSALALALLALGVLVAAALLAPASSRRAEDRPAAAVVRRGGAAVSAPRAAAASASTSAARRVARRLDLTAAASPSAAPSGPTDPAPRSAAGALLAAVARSRLRPAPGAAEDSTLAFAPFEVLLPAPFERVLAALLAKHETLPDALNANIKAVATRAPWAPADDDAVAAALGDGCLPVARALARVGARAGAFVGEGLGADADAAGGGAGGGGDEEDGDGTAGEDVGSSAPAAARGRGAPRVRLRVRVVTSSILEHVPSSLRWAVPASELAFEELLLAAPGARVAYARLVNASFTSYGGLQDQAVYYPHPTAAGWTVYRSALDMRAASVVMAQVVAAFRRRGRGAPGGPDAADIFAAHVATVRALLAGGATREVEGG